MNTTQSKTSFRFVGEVEFEPKVVQSFPSLLFFRDNQVKTKPIGTASSKAILAKVQAVSQGAPAASCTPFEA